MVRFWLVLLLGVAARAKPMVLGTYDADTEGKYLFLFYHTFWCGEPCAAVRPAWRRLEESLAAQERVLVGEVDCADVTEMLCANVTGSYPRIGYGAADTRLAIYDGDTDAASLEAFGAARLPDVAALPPRAPRPKADPSLLAGGDRAKAAASAAAIKSFLKMEF